MMVSRSSVDLISHFFRRYPRRSAVLVLLLLLSGLAEGIGIVTLLPVIEIAMLDASELSPLSNGLVSTLNWLGLAATLPLLLAIVVLAIAAKAALQFVAQRQVGNTVAHVATDLRLEYIRAILGARWSFFVAERAGRIATAVSGEAMRAAGVYRHACAMVGGLIHAAVYMLIALRISWPIALIAAASGLGIAMLLGRLVDRSRTAGRLQTTMTRALISRITDALQGIKPIKAMGREGQLQPLLEAETHGINDAYRGQVLAAELRKAVQEPLLVVMLAVALYVAIEVLDQPVALVMLLAFLFHRLAGKMNTVQTEFQTLAAGESAFYSIQSGIRSAREAAELKDQGVVAEFDREIEFLDVCFAYGEKKVLHEVSLTIPAGRFVTIVGPSGSGKTTIADLLAGLQRPDSGSIRIDGRALDEVALTSWRGVIGYVPQDLFLFHDTLRTNITLGTPGVSDSDVWDALRLAGASEFVAELPAGLDTIVGERGSRLSGGQRQRIAIARALCGTPKLLILDEVTASLDPQTEAELVETLRNLRGRVTILAISHQAALKEPADIVYQAREGRVRQVAPVALTEA